MAVVTINSKGQLTLPPEVLERLNLKPGQPLNVVFHSNAITILIGGGRLSSLDSLYGMLHRPGSVPLSTEEMEDAIAEGACRGERD